MSPKKRLLNIITIILLICIILNINIIFNNKNLYNYTIITQAKENISENINNSMIKFSNNIYYVDSKNGNNDNNGTTSLSPWKTISKIESEDEKNTFKPGDRIKLKRNGIFILKKNIYIDTCSGKLNNPIIWEDYGTGELPIINGNNKSYCFYLQIDFFSIFNVKFIQMNNAGLKAEKINTTGILVKGCHFLNCDKGIFSGSGGSDFEISNCNFYNMSSISVGFYGTKINGWSNTKIHDCLFINGGNDVITFHEDLEGNSVGSNHYIYNNTLVNTSNENLMDITSGKNIKIFNNTLSGSKGPAIALGHSAKNIEIYNNKLSGQLADSHLIHLSVPDVSIWGNKLIGSKRGNGLISINNNANHNQKNITIVKNTLIYNGDDSVVTISDKDGNLGNVNISHNVISTLTNSWPYYWIEFFDTTFTATDNNFTCDYNVWGPGNFSARDRNRKYSFSDWQKIKNDLNGFNENPKFTNTKQNDFSPTFSSPSIDLGPSRGGYIYDLNGIRSCNDAGAYEYLPPYKIGEDKIDIMKQIRIYSNGSYRYISDRPEKPVAHFILQMEDMNETISKNNPRSNWIDIEIETWNTTGDFYKSWTELCNQYNNINRKYIIKDLCPDRYYEVIINEQTEKIIKTDYEGSISFNTYSINNTIQIKKYNNSISFNLKNNINKPRTGSLYTIELGIQNNNPLQKVKMQYEFDNLSKKNTADMQLLGKNNSYSYWKSQIDIPLNSTIIQYTFIVIDNNGIECISRKFQLDIIDSLPPVINDLTSNIATAGEILSFIFNIEDNIGLSNILLEYWFINENHHNITLIGYENFSWDIIIPNKINNLIFYTICAMDTNGNKNKTLVKKITIDDEDIEIIRDKSSLIGTTGDNFNFNLEIKDPNELETIFIEYWQDNKPAKRIILSPKQHIYENITLPCNNNNDLYYQIIIKDRNDHYRNSTIKKVKIIDNDPPELKEIDFPIEAVCGNKIDIKIKIVDNIGIKNISIIYWDHNNITYKYRSNEIIYLFELLIPINTKSMGFILISEDFNGNILKTTPYNIDVIDNKDPIIEFQNNNGIIITGNNYIFEILAIDNIGINTVFLEYQYSTYAVIKIPMIINNNIYSVVLDKFNLEISYLKYWFNVTDISGNNIITSKFILFENIVEEVNIIHVVEVPNSNFSKNDSSNIINDNEINILINKESNNPNTVYSNKNFIPPDSNQNIPEKIDEESKNYIDIPFFNINKLIFFIITMTFLIFFIFLIIYNNKRKNQKDKNESPKNSENKNSNSNKKFHTENIIEINQFGNDYYDRSIYYEIDDICSELDEMIINDEINSLFSSIDESYLSIESYDDFDDDPDLNEIELLLDLIDE